MGNLQGIQEGDHVILNDNPDAGTCPVQSIDHTRKMAVVGTPHGPKKRVSTTKLNTPVGGSSQAGPSHGNTYPDVEGGDSDDSSSSETAFGTGKSRIQRGVRTI